MLYPMISWKSLSCVAYLLSTASAAAANGDIPDFSKIPGFDKPCPNYRCTSGLAPVQKSRSEFSSKGCFAMSGSFSSSAGLGNELYAACCDQWYACYQICAVTKKTCDKEFKMCSTSACGDDKQCASNASTASLMSTLNSCDVFNADQEKACECVDKGEAEMKRTGALLEFYKEFSPEGVNKAPALAKKSETTTKMAALFRKLLAKYPKAIKKVEDPRKKIYESMMNREDLMNDIKKPDIAADNDEDNIDDVFGSDSVNEL
mmetsp:Transcript_24413/g.48618  ORF Transcript_24413/g.48618 Transcript_24413/m.48618 type:complete len:261 (+) Transcript_24413:146-928(+)